MGVIKSPYVARITYRGYIGTIFPYGLLTTSKMSSLMLATMRNHLHKIRPLVHAAVFSPFRGRIGNPKGPRTQIMGF